MSRDLERCVSAAVFVFIFVGQLGLNEQMLTVICTNRRKQYLITTGEEELTRCIVGHLDKAIRDSERDLPRLSILTDPTTQRIALRKWAARESNMHVSHVDMSTRLLASCQVLPLLAVSKDVSPKNDLIQYLGLCHVYSFIFMPWVSSLYGLILLA